MLGECIPQRLNPVVDGERDDIVPVSPHRIPRSQLTDRYLEWGPLRAQVNQHFEGCPTAGWAVHLERLLAALEAQRSQESRDTEEVVRVHMRDEDRVHGEPRPIAHHLALRALTAVEQHKIALPLDR